MTTKEEYLKRYLSGASAEATVKKKKKKKTKPLEGAPAVKKLISQGPIIVDHDLGFKKPDEPEPIIDEPEEDAPILVETEGERRMREREERLKNSEYFGIKEDGSGWVQVEADGDDLSPPRKGRTDADSPNDSEGDLSPPRKRQRDDSQEPRELSDAEPNDLSPPRRSRDDLSPPRQSQSETDLSPPRRARHDSAEHSLSPPNRPGSTDLSPPRRTRPAADLSPPRRAQGSSPDLSPPRRGKADSEDLSPPRKSRSQAEDLSPPRKSRWGRSPTAGQDLSPPRRSRADSLDISPPRKSEARGGAEDWQGTRNKRPRDDDSPSRKGRGKKPVKMSDGSVTGLIQGKDLSEEMDRKRKREAANFAELSAEVTGRAAQTTYRNKKGQRISEEELQEQRKAEKEKREAEKIRPEWGAGLKQQLAAQEYHRELAEEASKPFARTRDDKDLDMMFKTKTRWGDPMAHLVKDKGPVLSDLDQLQGSTGFKIPTQVPSHSWLKRGIGPCLNRYQIRPGRHWDGVDRSNGFENDLAKSMTERESVKHRAYKWSVEEM